MIKRALTSLGLSLSFVAFMVACVAINLALQGNLGLDVSNLGPTWW